MSCRKFEHDNSSTDRKTAIQCEPNARQGNENLPLMRQSIGNPPPSYQRQERKSPLEVLHYGERAQARSDLLSPNRGAPLELGLIARAADFDLGFDHFLLGGGVGGVSTVDEQPARGDAVDSEEIGLDAGIEA